MGGPGLDATDGEAVEVAARLRDLLAGLELPPGAFLEDKRLTATVHIRPRRDAGLHARTGRTLAPLVEGAGFRLRPGKASWEIRPAAARDKGDAVRGLIDRVSGAHSRTTLYAGDDVTDEDAFRALPDGVTVRVGLPDEGETAARYFLPSPAETYRFLSILAPV